MIAKRIVRRVSTSGQGLLAYVIHEKDQGRADPVTWQMGDYITDIAHDGDKLAWAPRISNCVSTDVGWASKEILANAAKNTRSRGDKFYHLVISFPDGERPTQEQMEDIEDTAVAAIGLSDHKRIAAVHGNTDHLHLHVAICKVHPTSLRNIEPYYDFPRLQAACATLELRHGLTVDNHMPLPDQQIGQRAADMEAHSGRMSFTRWAQETLGEAIIEAAQSGGSWQDLHTALAEFDVAIKPRGAGLVLTHRQEPKYSVKASDIARELSIKSLTDRWGVYVPAGEPPALPAVSYDRPPMQTGPQVPTLLQRYQAERTAANDARRQALAVLRHTHLTHSAAMKDWYSRRMLASRQAGLSRADRLASYQHINNDRLADIKARTARERAERQELRDKYPVLAWKDFLEREASAGEIAALSALRSRARKRLPIIQQIIASNDPAEALDVIRANLKPHVGRNGDVFYSIGDGGEVTDGARFVSVRTVTTGAIILAVDLAASKFAGHELIVRGTPDFERRVTDAMQKAGFSLKVKKSVEIDKQAGHTVLVKTNIGISREPDNRGNIR